MSPATILLAPQPHPAVPRARLMEALLLSADGLTVPKLAPFRLLQGHCAVLAAPIPRRGASRSCATGSGVWARHGPGHGLPLGPERAAIAGTRSKHNICPCESLSIRDGLR